MIDDSTAETASLYVLDLLEPAEARAFEQRLGREPELRALVDELTAATAALAHAAPPRPLPPALAERVFAAVRVEQKVIEFPGGRRRGPAVWLGWAVAACLAVVCAWLFFSLGQLQQHIQAVSSEQLASENTTKAEKKRADELSQDLAAEHSRSAALQAALDASRSELAAVRAHDELSQIQIANLTSKLAAAPDASATVLWDEQKQRGILRTKKLPAPPADHDYQLWVIDASHAKPVDAGVFGGSKQEIDFRPGDKVSAPKAFAVSLEAKGGVPEAKGPIVLIGN